MRVVLLRDSGWPDVPGVCCWRTGARAAFTAAGADVVERVGPASKGDGPARARKVTDLIRRIVSSDPEVPAGSVILAESLRMAGAALGSGAPAARLWALALPPTRGLPGDSTPFGRLVNDLAPRIAGFVTDSEPGRDALERTVTTGRPRVVLLPPVVPDRACPSCPGKAAATSDDDDVAQLIAWRYPSDTYSFPMARRRGLAADWAPADLLTWAGDGRGHSRPGLPDTAPDWTAAAQERGARALLAAALPPPASGRPARAVLVSGFDLKFIRDLAGRLDQRPDLTVTLDEWQFVSRGTDDTPGLAARADTVVGEWARPSAVWFAKHKRPGQHLVIRLHRFELDAPYPRQIDIDKVDAVVYIAPALGVRIREELGWPKEKLVYIPNFLDIDWLDRPKLPDARFTIGMVGTERALKRLDLALDVVAAVRRADPRFVLHVRSIVRDSRHAGVDRAEQEYAGWVEDRVEREPILRGGVVFEPPGRDMARWYRRVGCFLSMSDIEGVHLAAAEAMASGAVPAFRPWPGVREVYDDRWIHGSVDEAAAALCANADPRVWAERSAAAKAEMRRRYDPAAVLRAWADLLHGDLDRAREPFDAWLQDPR